MVNLLFENGWFFLDVETILHMALQFVCEINTIIV